MKTLVRSLALLLVVLTGCEKKCLIPPGDYVMTMTSAEGDCPPNIVEPFESMRDAVTVEANRECKRFSSEATAQLSANCRMRTNISAQADQKGLHDGQAEVTVTCDDGFTCRQFFGVTFEPAKNESEPRN